MSDPTLLTLYQKFLTYLPRIPIALIICAAGWFLGKTWNRFYIRISKKSSINSVAKKYIGRTVYIAIFCLALIIALSILGLDISPLLASIGAGGLIIGFGVRETVSDFASGLLILMYRPFKVGDFVKIGVVEGEISVISPVNIEIKGKDGKRILVPNRSAWGQVVYNSTKDGKNITTLQITVSSESDEFEKVLDNIFKSIELKYRCIISGVSTAGIIYSVYIEIPKDGSCTIENIIKNIWLLLKEKNITATIAIQP